MICLRSHTFGTESLKKHVPRPLTHGTTIAHFAFVTIKTKGVSVMNKALPKISKYMSTTPHAVNSEAFLSEAMEMMNKNQIRHLPVIKNGKVFGLVSDRDIKSIFAFAGANPKTIKVGDVCVDDPYVTKPEALLNEVADEMVSRKVGSALVMDNGKLVGIFTATDACRALSEICQGRFH